MPICGNCGGSHEGSSSASSPWWSVTVSAGAFVDARVVDLAARVPPRWREPLASLMTVGERLCLGLGVAAMMVGAAMGVMLLGW